MYRQANFLSPLFSESEIASVAQKRIARSGARQIRNRSTAAALTVAMLFGIAITGEANADSGTFKVFSPTLKSGTFDKANTLNAFGCVGSNISPAIQWSNAPVGTKSFSLQMQDIDAPAGNSLWHWTVYNIPASANGLPEGAGNASGSLPAPAYGGANDFLDTGATGGNGNYGGPCPPAGDKPHRYVFTLYALAVADVEAASGIPKTGSPALHSFIFNKGIGDKLLGKASFTASYGR